MRKLQRGKADRGRRGFTLLELLLVVAILVMLAVMIVPNFVGVRDQAKIDLCRSQIKSTFKQVLKLYNMHVGQFPTTEEGLRALLAKPEDEAMAKKWHGPYLDVDPETGLRDPWGLEYQYRSPGEHNEGSYDLWSTGPDKEDGTEDDIANWAGEDSGMEGGDSGGGEAPMAPIGGGGGGGGAP